MTRTPKSPKPEKARRTPLSNASKKNGDRRTRGERRSDGENRREFARYSPTQKPSERRQSERRTGSSS